MRFLALISGGKDSILSLLHTEAALAATSPEGVAVVGMGNVHPATVESENVTDSYMYQSAFANVTPRLAECLGLPILREVLRGRAVFEGLAYDPSSLSLSCAPDVDEEDDEEEEEEKEEVECLTKLLARAKTELNIDAVSVGAVLSTYQRTRVESVALRLGLTVFAPLWQYPVLPGADLLQDLEKVGLEARIVKVASGALDDEKFLWTDIVSSRSIIERAIRKYGIGGDDGSESIAAEVIGEGGEYESFVVAASRIWRKRLEIEIEKVWLGAGNGYVVAKGVRVVDNPAYEEGGTALATLLKPPKRWDDRFERILSSTTDSLSEVDVLTADIHIQGDKRVGEWDITETKSMIYISNFVSSLSNLGTALGRLETVLKDRQSSPDAIVSVLMLIRNSSAYGTVNELYSKLFSKPLPPSRVAVFCGKLLDTFAGEADIAISLSAEKMDAAGRPSSKKGLHVQSRSYWAPANIGPYSQARNQELPFMSSSVGLSGKNSSAEQGSIAHWNSGIEIVHLAGQIPLDPFTMTLNPVPKGERCALGLQHLTRVAKERRVRWFVDGIAFIAKSGEACASEVQRAAALWSAFSSYISSEDEDQDEDIEEQEVFDLWRAKYDPSYSFQQTHNGTRKQAETLPDWSLVSASLTLSSAAREGEDTGLTTQVPFLAAVVEALPRDVPVEWWTSTALSFSNIPASSVTVKTEPLNLSHGSRDSTIHLTNVFTSQNGSAEDDDEQTTLTDKKHAVLAQGIAYLHHLADEDDIKEITNRVRGELSTPHNGNKTNNIAAITTMRFVTVPRLGKVEAIPGTVDVPCYGLFDANVSAYVSVVICRAILEV